MPGLGGKDDRMEAQVTFWGVRGSVPVFDLGMSRYGGNTSCIEVRTPAGGRVIVDGGTGVRGLGQFSRLESQGDPIQGTVLISHYHWDHIQGIPFSSILYDPRNSLAFYGLYPEVPGGMEGVLQGQMSRPYFPVDMGVLAAAHSFTEMEDGARITIDDAVIEARNLNHPQGCLGFRIETAGGIVVYASDNEPGDAAGDRSVRELARDADVLIYDAQFSPELFAKRKGWGHSTWAEGVRVAQDANARHLVLFHHDPGSDDSMLDALVEAARRQWKHTWAAAEGMVVTCHGDRVVITSLAPRIGPRYPAKLTGWLAERREGGSRFPIQVAIENLTIKGAYVLAADVSPLHSEVELQLSGWNADPVLLGGRVVRCEQTGDGAQVGIGIVFSPQAGEPDRRFQGSKKTTNEPE